MRHCHIEGGLIFFALLVCHDVVGHLRIADVACFRLRFRVACHRLRRFVACLRLTDACIAPLGLRRGFVLTLFGCRACWSTGVGGRWCWCHMHGCASLHGLS
jgi:hypothetical protein